MRERRTALTLWPLLATDILSEVRVAQRSDQIGDDAGAELPRHIRER